MKNILSNISGKKDKNKKSKSGSEPILDSPSHDFIPYACHWDSDTILTKNGELLQIIKITGFSSEAVGSEKLDLREVIREAVSYVDNDEFAFWINTIRRMKNLDPGGEFPIGFSDDLNKAWKSRHGWNETYINEVYITVIKSGTSLRLRDGQTFLRSLFLNFLKKSQSEYVDSSKKEVYDLVNKMLEVLEPFGAKRLSLYESEGVFYSEPLQFFYKLLNLDEDQVKVPIHSLSESVMNNGVAIGFNTMEIRGRKGKRFGAVFSLKEYYELSGEVLDSFMQLPQEYIITQTLDFIRSKEALSEFSHQRFLLKSSKDDNLAEATGLEDVIQSDRNNETDFGESQMTIFVFNNSVDGLEKDVNRMSDALTDLGILAPRRDLRLEECYWMQLPANFSMVKKQKPLATALIGGYASLFNYPAGKRFGNHWGLAVTMFRTVDETPFFFNFHVGDNGHTSIIGPKGMGKTVMTNFMVSEARKFNGKVFFFDQESASKVFIKSIGGYYTSIDPETPSPDYAFNPFNIPDTPQNRKFLKEWIVLLAQMGGQYLHFENEKLKRVKESRKQKKRLKEFLTKDEAEHLASLVDKIYELPQEQRRLSSIAESFNDFDEQKLAEKMSIWHGEGKYAHLFDNDRKGIVDLSGDIYGFAICDVVEDGTSLGPILSYLFYRIEMLLDGEPTIIILDEAWSLVNNEIFAPKLEGWLQRLKEKNAIVIFATEAVPNDKTNSVTNTITENIATKIFLPNPDASEFYHAYRDVWGLSENEYDIVSKIRGEKRQFMLKQSNDRSIVVVLDLSGLKEVKILSGDKKTVIMMNESIEKRGDDPKEWLPELYEKLESRD